MAYCSECGMLLRSDIVATSAPPPRWNALFCRLSRTPTPVMLHGRGVGFDIHQNQLVIILVRCEAGAYPESAYPRAWRSLHEKGV
jgi:hypothetical protein